MFHRFRHFAVLAAFASFAQSAAAQWPERPITLIVPWAAGGSTDILARALSEKLTASLGQAVIVENRAGASGNIGSSYVVKAKPDGYTLLLGSMSTHTISPALMPNMPFRGVEDFTPIAQVANVMYTLVVNSAVPVDSVRGLIDYARANPGKLAFASGGAGSTNHLSAVLFEKAAGIEMLHVPYKGGAPAMLGTVANQTQVLFSAATQTLPQVKGGKLKLLAITEAKRSDLLPDTPTVAETLPDYAFPVWYGLFGPAGLPADLVARLNEESNKAMSQPDVRARMDDIGVEVVNGSPQQFADVLRDDAARFAKVIRELDIKAE